MKLDKMGARTPKWGVCFVCKRSTKLLVHKNCGKERPRGPAYEARVRDNYAKGKGPFIDLIKGGSE